MGQINPVPGARGGCKLYIGNGAPLTILFANSVSGMKHTWWINITQKSVTKTRLTCHLSVPHGWQIKTNISRVTQQSTQSQG